MTLVAPTLCAVFLIIGAAGCAVTGEPVSYQIDGKVHQFNAKVDGMSLTATVFMDENIIIAHSWPPFMNSRDEQVVRVGDHDIRSVLRIIKGIGNTTVQINIYMDEKPVGVFAF